MRDRQRGARATGFSPWLVALSGAVWLGFGLAAIAGLTPAPPVGGPARWGIGLTALLTAGAFFGVAVRLCQGIRPAFWLGMFLLAGVALVTLLGAFGWADVLILLLHLATLALLLRDRARYLREPAQEGGKGR